jgi:hypothetical protein
MKIVVAEDSFESKHTFSKFKMIYCIKNMNPPVWELTITETPTKGREIEIIVVSNIATDLPRLVMSKSYAQFSEYDVDDLHNHIVNFISNLDRINENIS